LADALDVLPDLTAPLAESLPATGTDGRPAEAIQLPRKAAQDRPVAPIQAKRLRNKIITKDTPETLVDGTAGCTSKNQSEADARLSFCLSLFQQLKGISVDSGRLNEGNGERTEDVETTRISATNQVSGSVCTSGGGPGLQNLWRV